MLEDIETADSSNTKKTLEGKTVTENLVFHNPKYHTSTVATQATIDAASPKSTRDLPMIPKTSKESETPPDSIITRNNMNTGK